MADAAREEFVSSYTTLVTRAWSDEDFARQLEERPREAAAEAGLTTPQGSEVVVLREFPEEPGADERAKLDNQFALWNIGHQTGRFELHVPSTPALDTSELSEDELENVAGGVVACCCCPCCCC